MSVTTVAAIERLLVRLTDLEARIGALEGQAEGLRRESGNHNKRLKALEGGWPGRQGTTLSYSGGGLIKQQPYTPEEYTPAQRQADKAYWDGPRRRERQKAEGEG